MANRNVSPKGTPEAVIQERRGKVARKNTLITFWAKLLVCIVVLWFILSFLFGIGTVAGDAMSPQLQDGDLFLYYRLESKYQIGDVVTFTTDNGSRCIGRIIAQSPATVDISDAGEVLVNGQVQEEEGIFYPTYKTAATVEFPCTLSEGQVFILCDFRTNGTDSRTYGAVPTRVLGGKIVTVLRRHGI